ncbi:MAG: 16S rRNA (cytosine(1402)-N(4))-methyltransferase RsmH [Firmicutes bacterium]|nr:16S rRNA (cytosine(1402)-N(4))-methyltransferase RsmH [Bacillota bacterium]
MVIKMHYSVLKEELLEGLNIQDGKIYVDATIGYAGDSKEILKQIPNGFLYGFDQDKKAVEYSTSALTKIGNNFKIFNTNFVNMDETFEMIGIKEVDGIIFDLGFSSPQIDDEKRGFSFMHDGPLDMRMSSEGKSAKDIINEYSENELAEIFFKYGEEKLSRVIAINIKKESKDISSTLELVEVIKNATGANYFYKNHPERKIFQALRIEVNEELTVLESILPKAIKRLKKGGRIAVITFHSLEDRIVKNIFKKYSDIDPLVKGLKDIPEEYKPLIKLVNKKPILPSQKELEENSRSRSAKLRIIERI